VVTLRPRDRRERHARVSVGSDDYLRLSAGASEPFAGGRGAVRVDAFREDSKQRAVRNWDSRQRGVYSAGRWLITPRTRLEYSFESTESRTPSTNTQPIVADAATRANLGVLGVQDIPGFPKDNYYGFTLVGDRSFNDVEVIAGDLSLSHTFSRVLSVRAVLNRGRRLQQVLGVNGTPYIFNTTRTTSPVAGGTSWIQFFEDLSEYQTVAQADALAQFDLGPTRHKLLVTFDYLAVKNADVALAGLLPAESVDAASYTRIGPILGLPPYLTDSFRNAIDDRTIRGVLVSERAILFRDRLHLLLGGRRDTIRQTITPRRFVAGAQTSLAPQVRPEVSATTAQSGLVFKVLPAVVVYANYSESFNPGSSTDLDYNGRPLGNQEGRGLEGGFKASALGERLNFTAGVFRVEKSNLPFTATNAAGVALPPASGIGSYRVTGSQRSQGFEVDLSFQPAPAWLTTLSYGRNDVQWTEVSPLAPRNQNLVGRAPEGVPDSNFAGTVRYEIRQGWAKGLNFRGAARYQGQAIIAPTITDAQGRLFFMPSYVLWDFAAGYAWKAFGVRHRADLNLRNAFDRHYYRGGPFAGSPRAINFSYELRF
jgi:outer membrane receptor protein involved in Fe transport